MEKNKGPGALKKLKRNTDESVALYVKKQDAYLSGLTMLITHTEAAPVGPGEYVTYTTKYARSKEGHQGRVYAQGVALSKAPSCIRQIAYAGISVRDWDVEMAYFTFDVQVVDKLKPILNCPHFQLGTIRLYIRDKRFIWNSMKDINNCLSDSDCKRLRNDVFSGGEIEERYMDNAYVGNIPREGRVMRWLVTYMIPDVYEKLDIDGKKNWAEESAESYFLTGIEARIPDAIAEHCAYLCSSGSGRVLDHISLQFGGAEIAIRPSIWTLKNPERASSRRRQDLM